jgi:hypothetical protein
MERATSLLLPLRLHVALPLLPALSTWTPLVALLPHAK